MKLNGKIESRLRKGAAVSLCGALILAGVLMPGTAAFQNGRTVSYADETAKKTEEQVNAAFPDLSKVSKGTKGLSKSETVYMIMDADGKEKETLVSEWLRNPDGKDTIEDHSELTDIKNTSGDEEFTQNDDKLTWQAGGRDIKYTGSSDGIIPVSCEVTYSLNGEKMSASEIAGKSGEVEIRFDYYVTARDRVSANGNAYEMVHPYVMASGVVLNEDHFRDIEVNSGKVLSEEGNSVCLGIALPGMKENLGLKKDIIDIPESVVVKAVTDRFEIDGTYTVALTGLLDDVDISTGDASDKLDQLESAFGKLSSASSKLVSGSRKLANGADKLANGADKLAGGADELAGGAKKLKKGSKKLEDGTDSLAKGASRLANGTSQLKKNSGSLAEGIGQLAGGAEALSEGAGGLKTGTEKAVSGAKDLSDGLSALSGNSEALKAGTAMIENAVFEGATAQLQQALIAVHFGALEAAADLGQVIRGIIRALQYRAFRQMQRHIAVQAQRAGAVHARREIHFLARPAGVDGGLQRGGIQFFAVARRAEIGGTELPARGGHARVGLRKAGFTGVQRGVKNGVRRQRRQGAVRPVAAVRLPPVQAQAVLLIRRGARGLLPPEGERAGRGSII